MSITREDRKRQCSIHILLALMRTGTNKNRRCMRTVIRDYNTDLKTLELRCQAKGGEWRIHHTVNARDPEKARRFLLKRLIDHPEKADNIDAEWRTALLQPDCISGDKKFMLDIDTEDTKQVDFVLAQYDTGTITKIKSPKGWHYITKPFDTREICDLPDVSLQRDGYYYVKTVGTPTNPKE